MSEENEEKSEVLEEDTEQQATPQQVIEANTAFDKKMDDNDGVDDSANEDEDDDSDKKETDFDNADEQSSKEEDQQQEDNQIDDDLLSRAENVGLSPEQVKSFSNSKDLENTLGILEARQNKKEQQNDEEQAEEEIKPFDCGLSKDDYDEQMVDAINKMGSEFTAKVAKLEKENAELKKAKDELVQETNDQAVKNYTTWFDKEIAALNDFEDIFGKGTIDDIAKDSKEFKNRAELDAQISTLAAGYRQSGRSMPTKEALFKMALVTLHENKIKQNSASKTITKLNKRASQAVGQGSRKGSAVTGIDKVLEINAKFDSRLDES